MLHKLMLDLLRLLGSWWKVDRVRVSPTEGRLLRIEPPCCVVVESRPAEVVARTTGENAAGPFVVYDCVTARGDGRLLVVPHDCGRRLDVFWTEDGVRRSVDEANIEVYAG